MCASQPRFPADAALADARRLVREGRYAESLERHLWYHDHALESEPGHYGVRLSFALSDWAKLGKAYPPALDALRAVRDKKTALLEAGCEDRELFRDVAAINPRLEETGATVTLLKRLDALSPDFASQLAWDHRSIESLISAREYALLRKHLGNPNARLDQETEHFKEGLDFAGAQADGETTRHAIERIFADAVVHIITVLRETGGREQAGEIQRQALALLDDPAIRNALEIEPAPQSPAASSAFPPHP